MNIIVTGASQGIGYELCLLLATQGHTVLAVARSTDRLTNLASAASGNLHTLTADITDPTSRQSITDWVTTNWPQTDALVNNAGVLINQPAIETTPEDLTHTFQTNLFAPLLLIRALYNSLLKSPAAHIVNIGSMGGVQGSAKFPGLATYSASKGALAIASECLAEEFKETPIKVNCLALGAAQTEMLAKAFPGYQAPATPKQMAEYIAHFTTSAHHHQNGKIIPVSTTTP